MSRIVIIILLYHHYKPTDLINYLHDAKECINEFVGVNIYYRNVVKYIFGAGK
jgi:hypothetical protein